MLSQTPRRIAAALVAVVCAAVATDNGSGQCSYEISAIIQGPHCGFGHFAPLVGRGMNSHGHVAGSWSPCGASIDEAFYWTPETGLITLPRPQGVHSAVANDITDSGLIVGGHSIIGVGWTGFVYNPNTRTFTYLQPLHPGATATTVSTVNAINNAGIAVGARLISKPGVVPAVTNAVIWNTNTGEVIDLGVGEGPNSGAMDGKGQHAVGWIGTHFVSNDARAWLWENDRSYALGILPGTVQSTASSTNIHKDVIGACRTPAGHFLAFHWSSGKMYELAPPTGFDRVGITDVTDSQQIYGRLRITDTNQHRPYIWQHGEFHMLDDLLVPLDGFTLSHASVGIADGRILADGGTVAAILAPVGQPLGDLNNDCRVDVHDLHMLLDAWGPIPRAKRQTGSPADLNGDGVVDVSDLLILLANWSN